MSAQNTNTNSFLSSQNYHTPTVRVPQSDSFVMSELERAIMQLQGISSTRVLGSRAEIDEIHILAAGTRAPKKIVRDIESMLLMRFGIRIDHRRVSIVQSDRAAVPTQNAGRPQICRIAREEETMHVILQLGEMNLIGQSPIHPERPEVESVVWALISAVEQLLQAPGTFELADIQVQEAAEQRIIVVLLRWIFSGRQEYLVGASLVHHDVLEAAARATLDSMNRRLLRV
jgi:hypothetical protein